MYIEEFLDGLMTLEATHRRHVHLDVPRSSVEDWVDGNASSVEDQGIELRFEDSIDSKESRSENDSIDARTEPQCPPPHLQPANRESEGRNPDVNSTGRW